MDPTVLKYLDDLKSQREEVEDRLRERESKRRESNEIFLGSVRKELEHLEKNRTKYEIRNKKFLEEARETIEGYKAELAKAYQADQALNVSKKRLETFIQKNYPKIVSELKSRLFQGQEDISKKLKSMREGGHEMIKLNSDIRALSDEIQVKKYELLEEEERRLRREGALRNYMYNTNPYVRPYDVSLLSRADRAAEDRISPSPNRGPERHISPIGGEDRRRPSAISKEGERGSQEKKFVSFEPGMRNNKERDSLKDEQFPRGRSTGYQQQQQQEFFDDDNDVDDLDEF